MEIFKIENLTFFYPNREEAALKQINLTIQAGAFITICGKSGCGKSTLLRHLKTTLTPYGQTQGYIYYQGRPLQSVGLKEQTSNIGYVLQQPESQIITDKVWHELAFGLESLSYESDIIRVKVAEMANFFGIQNWFHKKVCDLSGGQKQLLNLASIMTMQPRVLILDEPTSQLDPIAASEFIKTLWKINQELGTTIILSEHHLEEVMPISDRLILMEEGRILIDAPPDETGKWLQKTSHPMFSAMPVPMRIFAAVPNDLTCPLTVKEGRQWLSDYSRSNNINPITDTANAAVSSESPAVTLKGVYFRYEKDLPDVIKEANLQVDSSVIYAVIGGNGVGKSTMLTLLCGIHKPLRGKIKLFGKNISGLSDQEKFNGLIGMLPQNPQALFMKSTVGEDLLEVFSGKNIPKAEQKIRMTEAVSLCNLEAFLEMHPYDLSGGEQQRAALAKVLLLKPKILLLDEPTKGLDIYFKQKLAKILINLKNKGTTIVVVSHDIEFCAQYADKCAMLFDGSIVAETNPRKLFAGNSFYTTSANRMARHIIPNAITAEDVISACGGSNISSAEKTALYRKTGEINQQTALVSKVPITAEQQEGKTQIEVSMSAEQRKLTKRTLAAALIILITIPLTILLGIYFLGDRKYYFISTMIIAQSLLPFMLIFEGRKPQPRELVVLAVLCAIGVSGRMAFFMLPNFKPVLAIVIIAGVCFGGESGFLIGVITAFVSNFYFGQGPWTPWQMFSFGIIGFLAGILFQKGYLRRSTPALCIFGAVAALLIYGVIMNVSIVFLYQAQPNLNMFLISILSGIPFDLIHAASTVIFLTLFAKPMLEKLERIKVKYGLIN